MIKHIFYKLFNLSLRLGTRCVLIYNYILQTQLMLAVLYNINVFCYKPIFAWYNKKQNIYITKRNALYIHIQNSSITQYMEKVFYTFPAYMFFFFTYAQTDFSITLSVWLCYWIYFWCAILYIRSVIFVFPLAIKTQFSLGHYLAIWVLVWFAPMVFYMYIYVPFWPGH